MKDVCWRAGFALLALTALTGCPKPDDGGSDGGSAGVPSAEDWTTVETQKVKSSCVRCHAAPEPDTLPKARWKELLPTMSAMPGPKDVAPLSEDEVALALAYYTRNAPEALPWREPTSSLSPKLTFKKESFTPPDKKLMELRIPSVSNVRFAFLSSGKERDVLFTDMRTSTLMFFSPWRNGDARRIRRLAKDLNYPVHLEMKDVNLDTRTDIMVAGMGDMNPTNDSKGSVILLLQAPNHKFLSYTPADSMARTADVRATDIDADGDNDLIVTEFGWRGPGQLQVFENKSGSDAVKPDFKGHVIDDRDGFIHVEYVDLDGDKKRDIVAVLSQEHEQVVAFINKGGLKFKKVVLHRAAHPSWGYSGMQLVDMDHDNDMDILVSNGDTLDDDLFKPYHGVSWLENKGKLKFKEHRIGELYGCERAVAADMDSDGDMDVVASAFLPQIAPSVWRDKNLDSLVWFEKQPNKWRKHSIEKTECIHPTLDVDDYNGDGKPDVVVGNYVWLEGEGQGKPTHQADYITLFTQE